MCVQTVSTSAMCLFFLDRFSPILLVETCVFEDDNVLKHYHVSTIHGFVLS